jgi:hypothetical protein
MLSLRASNHPSSTHEGRDRRARQLLPRNEDVAQGLDRDEVLTLRRGRRSHQHEQIVRRHTDAGLAAIRVRVRE